MERKDPRFRRRRELAQLYLDVLTDVFDELRYDKNAEQMVATTNEETLRRIFAREGYLQALSDVLERLEQAHMEPPL